MDRTRYTDQTVEATVEFSPYGWTGHNATQYRITIIERHAESTGGSTAWPKRSIVKYAFTEKGAWKKAERIAAQLKSDFAKRSVTRSF